jgi:molybdopterin synthase sulfur carrier subunit
VPTIKIPAPLLSYTSGNTLVEVNGQTVFDAMNDLTHKHPALRPHLFNAAGELRPYVKLFLNQEDIRQFSGVQTALKPEDVLFLVPSISGGTG